MSEPKDPKHRALLERLATDDGFLEKLAKDDKFRGDFVQDPGKALVDHGLLHDVPEDFPTQLTTIPSKEEVQQIRASGKPTHMFYPWNSPIFCDP